jgi:uncharacterized protein YukE
MGAISDMIFNFSRSQMSNVMGQISNQANVVSQLKDTAAGFGPKILMGWEGDDAQEFARRLVSSFLPKVADLIAAIAGCNTNISNAIQIMDKADAAVSGIADEVAQVFGSIF